ncbi:hypothetical protein [Halanaeroarchaeum sulfurireducens]|uniref:Uncharacterized protein n=1 Tax=Halanaeroarchaeum sulfurireducens TaxID=1604004 RepID=A0A0F7PET9_9EURY|nr:hypothetical protein [Halanaeroarchaeum sulfurireducens]AKH98715.1 hypothetical protein HLASF_3089 [Halanaeroarchaeum sulfurireducens]
MRLNRRQTLKALGVPAAATMGLSGLSIFSGNAAAKPDKCTKIQSGEINYSDDHYLDTVGVGYDVFGYNYQAHMFKGSYANAYLGDYGYPPYGGDDTAYFERLVDEGYAESVGEAEDLMGWYWSFKDTHLKMKWNDAWISNKDCDGDNELDRPDSYIGSGAWLANDMSGGQGKDKWSSFTKIVAVPEDAYQGENEEGTKVWYTAKGREIGPRIWGGFAIVQDVEMGEGATYVSPAGPGLGKYK